MTAKKAIYLINFIIGMCLHQCKINTTKLIPLSSRQIFL